MRRSVFHSEDPDIPDFSAAQTNGSRADAQHFLLTRAILQARSSWIRTGSRFGYTASVCVWGASRSINPLLQNVTDGIVTEFSNPR